MTPEQKRKAYYSLPSGTRKELAEMNAFTGFAAAASLNVDSGTAKNETPPLPDISCSIGGAPCLFELGEITDEDLAADVSMSLHTGIDGDGGSFGRRTPSQDHTKKGPSTYETNGAPLDLVLHYDKQYPFAPAHFLKDYEADIFAAMRPNGPFSPELFTRLHSRCEQRPLFDVPSMMFQFIS